jgi:hypothetical protein
VRLYVATNGRGVLVYQPEDGDTDGLPDPWEREFGLDPESANGDNGRDGEPDRDGVTNIAEYRQASHPRGIHRQYFGEGAVGYFDTRFCLLNTNTTDSRVLLTHELDDGRRGPWSLTVPAGGSASVLARDAIAQAGLIEAAFSTVVESDAPVVADRYQWWGTNTSDGGSHLERAQPAPAATWYLAEVATHSGFRLFYLLHNPGDTAAAVEITYLQPAPLGTLVKGYDVARHSRMTIAVTRRVASSPSKAAPSSASLTPARLGRWWAAGRTAASSTATSPAVVSSAPRR